MNAGWQDVLATVAALAAAVWLLRRWIATRRAHAGCDRCAAALARSRNSRGDSRPEASTR